jgi:hypothetical protein
MNKHAEIIQNTVYHTYPYHLTGMFNPDEPHSEDCGGCLINTEVKKLVAELERLSHVENVIAELEHEKIARAMLSLERHQAFEKAGVVENGSVVDLVAALVDERDLLASQLHRIKSKIHILISDF